ncbi:MAG TPA: hypothetical protein ENN33_05395 [Ignavibacteria bacterium]|nr:hypothetical protein [Ignavibacteria bacterium]
MAEFTMAVTKPDGHVVQIGDNDSGRLVKPAPVYHRMTVRQAKAKYLNLKNYHDMGDKEHYYYEDHLEHKDLISAVSGLIDRADFRIFGGRSVDTKLIEALSGHRKIKSENKQETRIQKEHISLHNVDMDQEISRIKKKYHSNTHKIRFDIPESIDTKTIIPVFFFEFGLYIWRTDQFFLSVRCGPIGRNGRGGHAHNDQLAIELFINGQQMIADPGTYVYTADPRKRNQYRSVQSHFAPAMNGSEPGSLDLSLFRLGDSARAKVLYASRHGFVGYHKGFHKPVYRIIEIARSIQITDVYSDYKTINFRPLNHNGSADIPFSPSYGYQERRLDKQAVI